MQLWAPGRHGRLEDFLVDAASAARPRHRLRSCRSATAAPYAFRSGSSPRVYHSAIRDRLRTFAAAGEHTENLRQVLSDHRLRTVRRARSAAQGSSRITTQPWSPASGCTLRELVGGFETDGQEFFGLVAHPEIGTIRNNQAKSRMSGDCAIERGFYPGQRAAKPRRCSALPPARKQESPPSR